MTLLLRLALFALGTYLSIRVIATLYRIIDLWYTIGTAYQRVCFGILGWGTTLFAIAWLLDRPYRTAYVSGLLAFLLFYLSMYPLRHLLLRALRGATGKQE